jgi:hypothetical protein
VKRHLVPLFLVCMLVSCSSCAWLKSEAKQTASDVIDCTTDKALEVAKEYGPSVELALRSQLSDTGQIDRQGLKDLAKSFASDTGRCVLARAMSRLLLGTGSDTQAAPLPIDAEDLTSAWTEVRHRDYGGKSFALER